MAKLLNKHSDRKEDRLNLVTREEWESSVAPFPASSRYSAANLAAHNWDVAIVGEYLLVSSYFTVGYWHDKNGYRLLVSDKEQEMLYPRVERGDTFDTRLAYDNAFRDYNKNCRRTRNINEAALEELEKIRG
jgi:hypothetical protein